MSGGARTVAYRNEKPGMADATARKLCNDDATATGAAAMQALRHADASIAPPPQQSSSGGSGWLIPPTLSHGEAA
jgi:hypothetical protein